MLYLYNVGLTAHRSGIPVMRSMFLEFPEDCTARVLDNQYMLGPSLLVAPVFNYEGDVEYYLPAGTWVNWFTGEKVHSQHGQWRHEHHGFNSIPLWIRENSIVATHPGADRPDYDYLRDCVLKISLNSDAGSSARTRVENEQGDYVEYEAICLDNGRIEVKVVAASDPVSVSASSAGLDSEKQMDNHDVQWEEL